MNTEKIFEGPGQSSMEIYIIEIVIILLIAFLFGYFFCALIKDCLLYTSPSPRDPIGSRMPSSA